jgi:hypothetical protein
MEERIIVADPVADPQGYQRELLALLGTNDPVEVLAATPATIRQQTRPLAAEVLDRRPAAREWSVAELLGHLWDAEIAHAFRARLILTRDHPQLIGYDQEAWARLVRPPIDRGDPPIPLPGAVADFGHDLHVHGRVLLA